MGMGSCLLSGHCISASGHCVLEACVIEALSASSKGGCIVLACPWLQEENRVGCLRLQNSQVGEDVEGRGRGAGELTGS